MNRFFKQLSAALLVPALCADPSIASALTHPISLSPTRVSLNLFNQQAVVPTLDAAYRQGAPHARKASITVVKDAVLTLARRPRDGFFDFEFEPIRHMSDGPRDLTRGITK